MAHAPPRGQRQVERANLRAARVNLQTEQVVTDDRRHRRCFVQLFLGQAQGHQPLEHRHHEMPAAHARVEGSEGGRSFGPALERASGGRPFAVLAFDPAEIAPRAARQRDGLTEFVFALGVFGQLGIRGEDFAGVPRAEGVIQEEVHHVILGEELGDGGEFVGADLLAGFIDDLLLVGLPELVGPAEGIGGEEGVGGEGIDEFAESDLALGGEGEVEDGVAVAEDAG